MKMRLRLLAATAVLISVATSLASEITFIPGGRPSLPTGSPGWKYRLGTSEASTPVDLWRTNTFVEDGTWTAGATPLGYVTGTPNDPNGYEGNYATTVPTSSEANYLSVFLRRTFNVTNATAFSTITLGMAVDDGAVVWLNGREIARFQCCQAEVYVGTDISLPAYNADATTSGESAFSTNIVVNTAGGPLVEGTNVLCIQLFNANLTSSDLVLDASLTGTIDDVAPTVISQTPAAGSTVLSLTAIQVNFSEAVQGISETNLLINGVPAQSLNSGSPSNFTFSFSQPATGLVTVAIAPGITDMAPIPNALAPTSWTYTLNTNIATAQFRITEFMTSQSGNGTNTVRDEDGQLADWIEIYNPENSVATIGGWYLSDDLLNLTKWRFPAGATVPARGYLLVYATSKDRTNNLARLHTSFSLNQNEFPILTDATGTNVVSRFPSGVPQYTDISYGRDKANPEATGYYIVPTPGADNVVSGAGFAPEVQFSRDDSTFAGSFQLTLSVPDTNSVIRYVIVSSAQTFATATNIPNNTSTLYTGPITVNNTMQVRARAFSLSTNVFPGETKTKSYIQLGSGASNFVSTLPIVVLHTMGATSLANGYPVPDTSIIAAFFDTNNGVASLAGTPQLVKRAGVNLRGSSTQGYTKGSYALELWDEFNNDSAGKVLGLPEESDWVLYSPNQFDLSLMHNPLLHQFAIDMGLYSSRTKFVEVIFHNNSGALTLNTNATGPSMGDYNGIYVLEEKVKRDNNRVDIDRLDAGDTNYPAITGGFLLKIDRKDDNERTFSAGGINACDTSACQGLIYQDPDGLEMVTPSRLAQSNYIRNYINNFYTAIQGTTLTNATGTNHYSAYLDVERSLDVHIVNVLTCNADAYRLSGYMYKPRNGRLVLGPLWDCDRGQGTSRADGRSYNPRCWQSADPSGANGTDFGTDFFQGTTIPGGWFGRLFSDVDFWQAWVDRYQNWRQTALDTNRIVARITALHDIIREAQPREQRRWSAAYVSGISGSDTSPRVGTISSLHSGFSHAFDGTYQGEVNFQKRWYLERINFLDTNLLKGPVLTVAGGQVTNGTVITIADASGKAGTAIYYTLDGSDPRAPQGLTNVNARLYTGPFVVTNNVRVRARAVNANHRNLTGSIQAGTGGASRNPVLSTPWSVDNAVTYYVSVPTLAITEIMFNPEPPPAGNTNDADNFEYIELKNIGTNTLNLVGFRFTNGIDFTFTASSGVTSLAPGGYMLLVKNIQAFTNRYGAANLPLIAGEYGGNLDNSGERLTLVGAALEPIIDFVYNDGWYDLADGNGFALVLANDNAPFSSYGNASTWRISTSENGSPGVVDPVPPQHPRIIVSEALTHTDPPLLDTIELQNLSSTNVDIGGWYLSDSPNNPKKYQIPSPTIIGPGGFILFNESQFNVGSNAFSLSSEGDDVYLFSAVNGQLSGYAHGFEFGPAENPVTFIRYVNSQTNEDFVASATNTLGSSNSLPRIGPMVISEIHYHPPETTVNGVIEDNSVDEFVELHNISGASVPLFHTNNWTNTWKLSKGADFQFPTNVIVPANGYVLVVNFNPTNTALLSDFTNRFGVPGGVQIFGPLGGKLNNADESVKLSRPDAPNPSSGFVPYIQVDKVHYYDSAPWDGAADAFGPSLQRIVETSYADDPTNWLAAVPTPGRPATGGTPPTITQHPANLMLIEGDSTNLAVTATGTPPLGYQWRIGGSAIPGATNALLPLLNVSTNDNGVYTVAVFNGGGAVLSLSATVTVRALPVFAVQPVSQTNVVGSNTVFTAMATGTGFVYYQWRKDGTNIVNATNATLAIPNAQLYADSAIYDVLATDDVGTVASQPAYLVIRVTPFMMIIPGQTNTVVQGGSTIFNISAGPIHRFLPLTYRYLPNPLNMGTYTNVTTTFYTNTFFVLSNAQVNGTLRVVLQNPIGNVNVTSPSTGAPYLQVLADFDGDGIADVWEVRYGFPTNSAANASVDTDGDGMSNLGEYLTGTNPTNAASVLKLQFAPTNNSILQFIAESNIAYSVQVATNVTGGWQTISNVAAQNTPRTIDISGSGTNDQRYIRVSVP